MLSAGAGMAGIYAAAYSLNDGFSVVVVSGAIASALMMVLTIMGGNIVNAFGTGAAPASGQTAFGKSILGKGTKDALTGWEQKGYESPSTDGQAMPAQTNVSGIIGGLIGGAGGAMVFYAVYAMMSPHLESSLAAITIAGMVGAGVFLINCVLPAYVLFGKTEGIFDQKAKLLNKTFISCAIVTFALAVFMYLVTVVMK
jgi:tetrahydromethanopterin S-methyltransferase subunit D